MALLLGGAVALYWRQRLSGRGLALGLALWPATVLLVGVVAVAAHLLLRQLGVIPFLWVAYPADSPRAQSSPMTLTRRA